MMRGQTVRPLNRGTNERIQRSSVVERSAVNRLVVGSNPTAGARCNLLSLYPEESGRPRQHIRYTWLALATTRWQLLLRSDAL
jgi:hypothetical protein